MIDWTERKRYWRDTKWQMVATLAPYLLAVLLVPLYAESLNSKRILGMPLGYFAVCHGLLVIAAVVMMRFDSSEMGQNMTEVVAYGTAAMIERTAA